MRPDSRYNPTILESPLFGKITQDDILEDRRPELGEPGRVPDLSFLSANFSSESLQDPTAIPFGDSELPQAAFPANKRYLANLSGLAIFNGSPDSVGQPSFGFHQRTNSSSTRPRPRSALMSDLTFNAMSDSRRGSVAETVISEEMGFETPRASRNSNTYLRPNSMLFPPPESRGSRSRSASPSRNSSPIRAAPGSPYRARSPVRPLPFNFKPQDLAMPNGLPASPSLIVKPAHRKGHRYKHSSVSMNLFQEPLPIADANQQPELIPDLYPIPNYQELLQSASATQKKKLGMAGAHFLTSILVFISGTRLHQHPFSTLAHLVFYDSLGSLVVSGVDLMSNFEVWGKPSIAHPFGLGRLEVLAGFALSTSLVMVGCDLISHFVEELVFGLVDPTESSSVEHGAHHIHSSEPSTGSWLLYELVLVAVIAITWATSRYLFAQTPMSLVFSNKVKLKPAGLLDKGNQPTDSNGRFELAKVFMKNPVRLLTLTYLIFLTLIPLVPDSMKDSFGFDVGEASTLVVAAMLCYAGWNLVKTLGGILLLSFPYSDYDYHVIRATLHDKMLGLADFKNSYTITKLFLTKANPQLYLAGVDIRMLGASADDESRLQFEINRIIVNTVKEFDAECLVETTISMTRA